MKIIWSDFATKKLKEIYIYHKDNVNKKVADKLKKSIFSSTKQLLNQPNSGQLEPTLQRLQQQHRYLVCGNYKIIYKPVKEGILITDVFDTRQNPSKLNVTDR